VFGSKKAGNQDLQNNKFSSVKTGTLFQGKKIIKSTENKVLREIILDVRRMKYVISLGYQAT
jgi:hypothetical protein